MRTSAKRVKSVTAKYKGAVGRKVRTVSELREILNDPRQEFWKGLPPPRHRELGFVDLPGVAETASKGGFAKFVFNPNGSKTYIYYANSS